VLLCPGPRQHRGVRPRLHVTVGAVGGSVTQRGIASPRPFAATPPACGRLRKVPDKGSPITTARRFAWCNVRPAGFESRWVRRVRVPTNYHILRSSATRPNPTVDIQNNRGWLSVLGGRRSTTRWKPMGSEGSSSRQVQARVAFVAQLDQPAEAAGTEGCGLKPSPSVALSREQDNSFLDDELGSSPGRSRRLRCSV
jgi:hypothetical protein